MFVDLVCDSKVDLFVVFEIWFIDNDIVIFSEIILQGYNFYYCFCSDCRGGGIVLIFKEFINVEKVLVVGKGLFEVLEWLVNFVVIICL